MTLEKVIYPKKKEFGIHIVIIKKMSTNKNLKNQHPSWKTEAIVFLAHIMHSTIACKQASTKLILMIAEGPMHAVGSSSSPGHYKKSGKWSTSFLAEKSKAIAMRIQKNWKTT